MLLYREEAVEYLYRIPLLLECRHIYALCFLVSVLSANYYRRTDILPYFYTSLPITIID